MINLPEIRTHSLQQQSGAQSEAQAAAQSGAKSEAQAEAQPWAQSEALAAVR